MTSEGIGRCLKVTLQTCAPKNVRLYWWRDKRTRQKSGNIIYFLKKNILWCWVFVFTFHTFHNWWLHNPRKTHNVYHWRKFVSDQATKYDELCLYPFLLTFAFCLFTIIKFMWFTKVSNEIILWWHVCIACTKSSISY